MGIFAAQKGPWTFGLEGVYMKLGADGARTVTGPGGIVSRHGTLDVTNKMYVFQGSVGYRLLDKVASDVLVDWLKEKIPSRLRKRSFRRH